MTPRTLQKENVATRFLLGVQAGRARLCAAVVISRLGGGAGSPTSSVLVLMLANVPHSAPIKSFAFAFAAMCMIVSGLP